MLTPGSDIKIYLLTGHTDMRKGAASLALFAEKLLSEIKICSGAMFVFRGKFATKIKILWWDSQGFCLFYKALDAGKFPWPNVSDKTHLGITRAQLSMLIEGVNWRNPSWSKPPERLG